MKKVALKTRHALLMSCISLMTCFAMLIGATFAWFTDSVTSGVNRIVAGNLDVELYHSSTGAPTIDDANKVTGTTQLFKSKATTFNNVVTENSPYQLWEPGAMSYETFTVKNAGSLALKYQFAFGQLAYNTVTWSGETTGHNLTEVVKVAVIDGTLNSRTDGLALTYNVLSTDAVKASALEPGASETFTVVLYWAPNNNGTDNLFNLKNTGWSLNEGDKLYIDAGITLLASQHTSEADSFDNQYDANAIPDDSTTPISITSVRAKATTVANEATVITAGSVNDNLSSTKATISAGAVAANTEVTLVVEESTNSDAVTTIETTSGTPLYFDVSLEDQDGAEVQLEENGYIDVELDIGKNLVINVVNHRTTALTTDEDDSEYYSYNPDTGILTLHVTSLSPFSMGYDAAVAKIGSTHYKSLAKAFEEASDGDVITMLNNAIGVETVENNKRVTLDLAGKTISTAERTTGRHYYAIDNYGTIVINDSGNTGKIMARGIENLGGTMTINGGTFYNIDANGGAAVWNDSDGKKYMLQADVNAAKQKDQNYYDTDLGVSIANGSYTVVETLPDNYVAGGSDWNGASNEADVVRVTYYKAPGGSLTINDGKFVVEHVGSSKDSAGPGVINSKPGTSLTINGGKFTSSSMRTYAIIADGNTVINNCTVTGAHGALAFDAGTAEVNGGTFTCTEYYGCWITNDGTDTKVTINGGTFVGGGYGLYSSVDDGGQDESNIAITITGGSFTGTNGSAIINSQRTNHQFALAVKGGTYSSNPSDYVASGYTATESSGTWTVAEAMTTAQ